MNTHAFKTLEPGNIIRNVNTKIHYLILNKYYFRGTYWGWSVVFIFSERDPSVVPLYYKTTVNSKSFKNYELLV